MTNIFVVSVNFPIEKIQIKINVSNQFSAAMWWMRRKRKKGVRRECEMNGEKSSRKSIKTNRETNDGRNEWSKEEGDDE